MRFSKYILDTYGKLFCRARYYKVNQFLFNLSLRGLGVYNYENFQVSGEFSFLNKHLSETENPVILDVGANQGAYALLCHQIDEQSRIFCFEPHPQNFAILSRGVERQGIVAINQALSDTKGKLLLYDYDRSDKGSSHATLCQGVIEQVHKGKSHCFEVEVSTLDDFIEQNHLEKIALLKVDVEGHELEVLKGAKRSLDSGLIEAIQFEFTQINSTSRVFMKDFFDLLEEQYDFYRMLPFELVKIEKYHPTFHEIFGYQNIVCLRKLNNA